MLITHKQSLIMLSITCRCILYALVSVVVPWGVALGWVRMRLGGEKSTVYSLQKARLHHWIQAFNGPVVQVKWIHYEWMNEWMNSITVLGSWHDILQSKLFLPCHKKNLIIWYFRDYVHWHTSMRILSIIFGFPYLFPACWLYHLTLLVVPYDI